jgi:hypothetical protein
MAKTVLHVQAGLRRQQEQLARRLRPGLRVKFLPADRPCPGGISRIVVWTRFGGHEMARRARAKGAQVVEHHGGLAGLAELINHLAEA